MKLSTWRIPLRFRICLLVAALAVCVRFALPAPPAATLRGVADMLGSAVGGKVALEDFVWEASRGAIVDALIGRRVVFLARTENDAPRDVYRAAIRVTLEGKPIAVSNVVNLTSSTLGDEQGLVASGHHAAFAIVAFGAVQQVTLLDLNGQQRDADGIVDHLMGWLTNVQTTGSLAGLGRTEVTTNLRAQSVAVNLDNDRLGVSVNGTREAFAVSLASGKVVTTGHGRPSASSMQVPHLSKPPILWAVDTVRSVTGPAFIAWLEDHLFDMQDKFKRAGYRTFSEQEQVAKGVDGPVAPPPPPPPPTQVDAIGFVEQSSWPPQNLRTIWKTPSRNEGVWSTPRHKFLQKDKIKGAQAAPSYFYQTHVRPDPKRPWSKVWMVAMDSRQLRLGMEGGIDDPQPLTGARGEGRIPRDPAVLRRAVGAFNGGFKTTHGEYGMMVGRRVLLPPKPGGATIMVTDGGRTGFGTWPDSDSIPQDMFSFRQNLDPLVDGGRLNPRKRKQWGWHLHTTGMLTHRSGLCLTSTGHMVYAWGPEVTGETLGNAMIQAGCTYAVHLDMNPKHTAFAYIDTRKGHQAELLHPGMQVLAKRFIVWSPKDFFYLTLRRFGPPEVPGLALAADKGIHPAPTWAPSVFKGAMHVEGTRVTMRAISPKRTQIRLRAGSTGEESGLNRIDSTLSGRVLAAVVTGGDASSSLGVRINGTKLGNSHGGAAILYVDKGQPTLVGPSQRDSIPSDADWLELPLLAQGERLVPNGKKKGKAQHRSAMCVSSEGYTWIAQAKSVSYEALVKALRATQCKVIASLDAGTDRRSRVYRTGTQAPPVDRYDHPTIYVLGMALEPGAFRWTGKGNGQHAPVLTKGSN